jgi:hypothetical protein
MGLEPRQGRLRNRPPRDGAPKGRENGKRPDGMKGPKPGAGSRAPEAHGSMPNAQGPVRVGNSGSRTFGGYQDFDIRDRKGRSTLPKTKFRNRHFPPTANGHGSLAPLFRCSVAPLFRCPVAPLFRCFIAALFYWASLIETPPPRRRAAPVCPDAVPRSRGRPRHSFRRRAGRGHRRCAPRRAQARPCPPSPTPIARCADPG